MRMAQALPEYRAFSTNFTYFRHYFSLYVDSKAYFIAYFTENSNSKIFCVIHKKTELKKSLYLSYNNPGKEHLSFFYNKKNTWNDFLQEKQIGMNFAYYHSVNLTLC